MQLTRGMEKAVGKNGKKENNTIVFITILLLIVGLVYASGFGFTYDLYGKTILVAFIYFLYQMIRYKRFTKVKSETMAYLIVIIFQNIYTNYYFNSNYFRYVEVYLIPILFSITTITKKQLRIIGMTSGIIGIVVLYLANYTGYFRGWDGNTVSNFCFFSYAIFISTCVDITEKKARRRVTIFSIIYFIWLGTLNSRAAMLFSVVMLLFVFRIIPPDKFLTKKGIICILFIPIAVAIFTLFIVETPFAARLNEFSVKNFQKPIFDGRDGIWWYGFEIWKGNFVSGMGTFADSWHNSAVACLYGSGVVGYYIWIREMYLIWKKALVWLDDSYVYGMLLAFVCVWLHQSVEQGLVGGYGNPVIFTLLGLMLARINTLNIGGLDDE